MFNHDVIIICKYNIFFFRLFSKSADLLIAKALWKWKKKIYSNVLRNSLFFVIYSYKVGLSGTVNRFILFIALVIVAMIFFCLSGELHFYLLIYFLGWSLASFLASLFTYLLIVNWFKEMLLNFAWKFLQNIT